MSQENVEIVRRAIDAFNRRDADGIEAFITSDCVWFPALLREVEGTGFRGREGLDAYFAAFGGSTAAGGTRQTFATRILVIALPRHDRVQEIPECVWVLDRSDPDAALERPQRDLHRVAGSTAIAAG
jgi:hypothetical protein